MTNLNYKISIADYSQVLEVTEHDLRHFNEPGYEGLLAHPFPPGYVWNKEKMMEDRLNSWNLAVTEAKWSRSFILTIDDEILGHLNLKNLSFQTLHRAQLGMGLEEKIRNQGFGKLLMSHALKWIREQKHLIWVDLTVFAHNLPARKLYKSFGFIEHYTFPDKLRVNETSIDDVIMTLKIQ